MHRRFLRIFPLYYAVLLLLVVLGFSEVQKAFGWHALYQSNHHIMFLRGRWYGADVHFWSLAVEEQFYIMWPLLILWVPSRRLPLLMILAIVCGPYRAADPDLLGRRAGGYTRAHAPMPRRFEYGASCVAWLWQQERLDVLPATDCGGAGCWFGDLCRLHTALENCATARGLWQHGRRAAVWLAC